MLAKTICAIIFLAKFCLLVTTSVWGFVVGCFICDFKWREVANHILPVLTNGTKSRCFLCASTCERVGVLFFFNPELVQTPTHRGLGRCHAWFNKAKKHMLHNKANLLWILFNLCQCYYITVPMRGPCSGCWLLRKNSCNVITLHLRNFCSPEVLKKSRTGVFPLKLPEKRKTFSDMHAYRSLRKISSIAAELIHFSSFMHSMDLAKLGLPQCITPWQTTAAAMLKNLYIKVEKSKEPPQKFTIHFIV